MAIDTIPYSDVTNLTSKIKSFYPVRIPVSHWQLRHYISAPESDILYYASGHDIYCLNTVSKKRKHIAKLPFESRCTASGYGWVCVGGEEDGHFAAIKVNGSGPRALDVDSALPIDAWRQVGPRDVKVERIGEQIVNSISIHRIQDEAMHLDDIVAVLTNNDKTVRVYSLPQSLETTVLDLPFAMNHATISPNGQILVAVGDENQAYFFGREVNVTPPQIPKPHNRLTSSSITWTLTNVVHLHVVPGQEAPQGYFTTAWSPNDQLVALGSEGGYISIFDVDMLVDPECDDKDAIVAVIPSSRADLALSHAGAVRSMMFSPDPWDLLVWAEDQGRICVADLRTGLRRKQIVHLEPKSEGLPQVTYEDVTVGDALETQTSTRDIDILEADFIQQYRRDSENSSGIDFAAAYLEARRRNWAQRSESALPTSENRGNSSSAPSEDDPQGLTAQEQQILENFRTARQREEARANGQVPTNVNYTSADMFSNRGDRPTVSTSRSGITNSDVNHNDARAETFPELSRTREPSNVPRPTSSHGSTLSTLLSVHEGSRGNMRASSISRLSDGSRLPRRRASVVLSPPPATNTFTSSATQTATTGNQLANTAARGDHEENPWRTIEEFVNLARGPLFERAAQAQPAPPLPAETETPPSGLQHELAAERVRARLLARPRDRWRYLRSEGADDANGTGTITTRSIPTFSEGYETVLRRSQLRSMNGREIGVRTAGIAMSPDGSTLWAACEEGIFEMELNVKGRMFWPAVEPL